MRLIPGKTKVKIELFKHITIPDIIVGLVGLVAATLCAISSLPGRWIIASIVAALFALLLFRLDDNPMYVFIWNMLKFFAYPRRLIKTFDDKSIKDTSRKDRKQLLDEFYGTSGIAALAEAAEEISDTESEETMAEEDEAESETAILASAYAGGDEDESVDTKSEPDEEDLLVGDYSGSNDEPVKYLHDDENEEEAEEEEEPESKLPATDLNPEIDLNDKKALKALIKKENKILKSKTATAEEKDAVWAARAERTAARKKLKEQGKDDTATYEEMSDFIPYTGFTDDGFIEYNGQYYGSVIEIDPIEFRFFSKYRRDNSIESCLGKILRSMTGEYGANIVKVQRPVIYDRYLDAEYDKLEALKNSYESGLLTEDELQSRVEIQYDRINEVLALCKEEKIIEPFYYLCLFESDKRQLDTFTKQAMMSLEQGELTVRKLDKKGLALFLKYSNYLDFDEKEIDEIDEDHWVEWSMPETLKFAMRTTTINGVLTHNLRVISYPSSVGDSWLAGVLSFPATKVVVKATPMDRDKAVRAIDRSLSELRGQYMNTSIDSKMIELQEHINTLSSLLVTLQQDNESLMSVNIYITAYDAMRTASDPVLKENFHTMMPYVADMKKTLKRNWNEEGMKLSGMDFLQIQSFIGSQVSAYDPMIHEARGIPTNTIAAMFPWIFAHISDVGGIKLGASDGVPVFIDFFKRNEERVNSNMVIVGKSGSGKSYATKSLLTNLASEDAKIFILDPENEYSELAHTLHGKVINVGNAMYGRLNPFHIITALDDDEAGAEGGGPGGSFATHLQFLEEFFRQILPDVDKEALEYLNSLVERVYLNFGITPETDLSGFTAKDYPIFDDLYDVILSEFERTNNEYLRNLLRSLVNYISKFSTGGRNANIWNGPSTVTTEENFSVFNFQSMLANRNGTIANAQMLLVLKYIDNEIIKNRDYNTKYGLNRKIVVVIDEAHVFIDTKFPIALDFMFQLAKRIRKYNGMQLVITQNIKDFVGSEDIARKSSAIINACQYSFVFGLAPNDMSDLCKLYEKAGGINEREQEDILSAKRGQAFVIMSPTSRSSFTMEVPDSFVEMFEKMNFTSNYFSGLEGDTVWEDFVSDSREAHDTNYNERKLLEKITDEEEERGSSLSFSEIDEESYRRELQDEDDDIELSDAVLDRHRDEPEPKLSAVDRRIAAEEYVNRKELEILTGRFGNITLEEVDDDYEQDELEEKLSPEEIAKQFAAEMAVETEALKAAAEDEEHEGPVEFIEKPDIEEVMNTDEEAEEDDMGGLTMDEFDEMFRQYSNAYNKYAETHPEVIAAAQQQAAQQQAAQQQAVQPQQAAQPQQPVQPIYVQQGEVPRTSTGERLYTESELASTLAEFKQSLREEMSKELEDMLKWVKLGAGAATATIAGATGTAPGGVGVAPGAGSAAGVSSSVAGLGMPSSLSPISDEEDEYSVSVLDDEDETTLGDDVDDYGYEEDESDDEYEFSEYDFEEEESLGEGDESEEDDEYGFDDYDDYDEDDEDEEDEEAAAEVDSYFNEEEIDFSDESEEYEPAPFLFAELLAEAAEEYASMDLEERMAEMNEQVLEITVEELGAYIKEKRKKK